MMMQIILAELIKARHKKRFWIIFYVLALLIPLIQIIVSYITLDRVGASFDKQGLEVANQVAQALSTGFSLARNNLGGPMYLLLLPLAAVVGSFMIGEERGYKMWKVILIAEPNRLRMLTAKFLAGWLLIAGIIIGSGISNALLGLLANAALFHVPETGDWLGLLGVYGAQSVVVAAPLLLSMLLSSVIAAPAMSLLATVLLPPIVEGVVRISVISQLDKLTALNSTFQLLKLKQLSLSIPKYFLTSNLNLGSKFAGQSLFGSSSDTKEISDFLGKFSWQDTLWSMEVSMVYVLIFGATFLFLWKRRDVLD